MMRCATTIGKIPSWPSRIGWRWHVYVLLLSFLVSWAGYAQAVADEPPLVPVPDSGGGAPGNCTACEASCGCESGGCSDYSQALATACDSCTQDCAGLGCGIGWRAAHPRPGVCLLDYVFGASCARNTCCAAETCGTCGCGQFWNRLATSPLGTTVGSIGSSDDCGDGGSGLGGVRLAGRFSAMCCNAKPGAGYVGDREPPVRCGMPAPTYPVPYPVPQHVGYTRFTYPPMMPHHSLPHYRHVYSYRHAPGLSRTNVRWRPTTVRNALAKLHHIIELPR